jgi:hypothetical protein
LPDSSPGQPASHQLRTDLSGGAIRALVAGLALGVLLYPVVRHWLPAGWHRPGTPLLQSAAILGSILLLVPYLFSLGKRNGASAIPNRLFVWHVVASVAGVFLVMLHALPGIYGPPLVLVLLLALLLVTGVFGRIRMALFMASTFGTKPNPFLPGDPGLKDQLRQLIRQKEVILQTLDPQASEAVFKVTLGHWMRSPLRAFAYVRLARHEARLTGARKSVPWMQAWWRPLHIALAWLFLAGLLLHIILATFFAGYVADGREIYWWHFSA